MWRCQKCPDDASLLQKHAAEAKGEKNGENNVSTALARLARLRNLDLLDKARTPKRPQCLLIRVCAQIFSEMAFSRPFHQGPVGTQKLATCTHRHYHHWIERATSVR